jgi:hypothetical protein
MLAFAKEHITLSIKSKMEQRYNFFRLTRHRSQIYTQHMKQRHALLLLLLLLLNLAACSPGHTGDNIIGFLRAGQLWTIDPSGANAFAIVAAGTPVVGYTWSPNHHIVAFRQLDSTFANTYPARHLTGMPVTGLIADTPSTLNTVGVDGGTPISIALSSPDVPYDNPFWINNGTRLLYRQTSITTRPQGPEDATWWVSQNDQPAGIAAKSLPTLLSLPSVDENNQRIAGSSQEGVLTTTLTGTDIRYRIHTPLNGHPLPASLERILWQPGSTQGTLLYAVASTKSAASKTLQVTLQLQQQNGLTTPLLSCACTQFAWSPNGQMLLYSTGKSFTLFSLHDKSSYTIQAEQSSVPYWSPDSRFLLLNGLQTLHLIQPAQHQDRVILNANQQADNSEKSNDTGSLLPASNVLLQPVANSSWASDSRHFLFTTNHRLYWQGQQLAKGEGLYSVAIDQNGQIQGQATLVMSGNVTQAGWTYQDPTSSFLY